jgi:hypothetical protein
MLPPYSIETILTAAGAVELKAKTPTPWQGARPPSQGRGIKAAFIASKL